MDRMHPDPALLYKGGDRMSNAPAAAKAKPGKDPALVHRKPLKTRL